MASDVEVACVHPKARSIMPPQRVRRTAPSPETIAHGVKSLSLLSFDPAAAGWIVADPEGGGFSGIHRSDPERSAYSIWNLHRQPDFVVSDLEGCEVLRISQGVRGGGRFYILDPRGEAGTIEMRGLLRTAALLKLRDGPAWAFRMPPFSLDFFGESDDGRKLWVQVGPPKVQWNLLLEPGAEDLRLVAGLAFLHRRWWCYG